MSDETSSAITPHANGAGTFGQVGKFKWFEAKETGLVFKPGMSEEDWLETAKQALAFYEGSRDLHVRAMFYVGDVLNHGEGAFGERFAQAIDATRKTIRMNTKTLQNAAWICGSIPLENRHELLTFSHHEAVAKLAADEQKLFLDEAEEKEWSVADLKKAVKAKFPGKPRGDKSGKKGKKIVIHLEDEKSVMLAAEKVAEFLNDTELCGPIQDMESGRQKEWSGRILAIVEGFEGADHDNLFQRLAVILGAYLDRIEETEPLRTWADKRKEKWTAGMNALAKAGRRMGVIGGAKPNHAAKKEEAATES